MRDSFCFIINVSADKGKAGALFWENIDFIKATFPESHFIYIKEGDVIEEHARLAANRYKYVVAVGGDGTVQQVTRGLLGSETSLGVLPLGSGNDFAKSLGLKLRFESDVEVLAGKNTNFVDVIKTNKGLFLNTFGMGIDGLTNYYASTSSLATASMRYFISALKALLGSEAFNYKCKIDGETITGTSRMIVVANGSVEGGKYEISPDSDISDGICEVVIVQNISIIRLVIEFLKLSLGIPFSNAVAIKKRCSSSLSITLDRAVHAHADGEIVMPADTFSFSVQKHAIPVITAKF